MLQAQEAQADDYAHNLAEMARLDKKRQETVQEAVVALMKEKVTEAQALAKMANVLNLPDRVTYWTSLAANVTREMDAYMWDEESGMHYDLFPNGTRMAFKTVAATYPLLTAGMNKTKIAMIVANLQSPDFWTAVPVPTVAVSTPDFSSDLDRGPMWEQQNFYIIRGLRQYGYDKLAIALLIV